MENADSETKEPITNFEGIDEDVEIISIERLEDRYLLKMWIFPPRKKAVNGRLKRLPLSHICRRAVHQALVNSEFGCLILLNRHRYDWGLPE